MHDASCDQASRLRVAMRASRILEIMMRARREGLLALEDEDFSDDPEMGAAVQLVCNGIDVSIVLELLVAHTFASERKGEALLSDLVLIRGVCSLSMAMNPDVLRQLFLAFLGNDPSCARILTGPDDPVKILSEEFTYQMIQLIVARAFPEGENDQLATFFPGLDDVVVCSLVRDIEEDVWLLALAWTSAPVLEKLGRNMGKRARSLLYLELAYRPLPSIASWNNARDKIAETYRSYGYER